MSYAISWVFKKVGGRPVGREAGGGRGAMACVVRACTPKDLPDIMRLIKVREGREGGGGESKNRGVFWSYSPGFMVCLPFATEE